MMEWFAELCNNHLLVSAFFAWAAAQILKTLIYALVNKTWDIRRLLGAGGMPSSHTATVTALATTAALEFGLDSAAFGIAIVLVFVVTHDAIGVRMEAGKHARILNEIMESIQGMSVTEERLKEFLGHTPFQVVCGGALGILTAVVVFFAV